MAAPKVYCYCENNCKYETLSKEQILAAIANAVETGSIGDCDTGFITTIKTITGQPLKFFVGEQAHYEALSKAQKENLFAIITNDTKMESLTQFVENLNTEFTALKESVTLGLFNAASAENAKTVKPNSSLVETTTISYKDNANTEISLRLEGGKTYLFSLMHYYSFAQAATFIMHIPEEARVRLFEHRYDLVNDQQYYAVSNTASMYNDTVRLVYIQYTSGGGKLMLQKFNYSNSTWEYFTSGRNNYILDIKYYEISTL